MVGYRNLSKIAETLAPILIHGSLKNKVLKDCPSS